MSTRRTASKTYDNKNRTALYERCIPCISEAIWKIIENSRNLKFRNCCKELLENSQVESLGNVHEALTSKLFMVTLGNHYISPGLTVIQEGNEPQTTTSPETAFGDLANHFECDIEENGEIGTKVLANLTQTCLVPEHQDPKQTVFNKVNMTPFDENFDSLEWHEVLDEQLLSGEKYSGQRVPSLPCINATKNDQKCEAINQTEQCLQLKMHNIERTHVYNEDNHFATLGDYYC